MRFTELTTIVRLSQKEQRMLQEKHNKDRNTLYYLSGVKLDHIWESDDHKYREKDMRISCKDIQKCQESSYGSPSSFSKTIYVLLDGELKVSIWLFLEDVDSC